MRPEKVITVMGMPSGGTSAVAGVLHHLGVDMGRLPSPSLRRKWGMAGLRKYAGFECLDATGVAAAGLAGGSPSRFVEGVRAYLVGRLGRAEGPVGVKNNFFCYAAVAEKEVLESLPMEVVRVHRGFGDVFLSQRKYVGHIPGWEEDTHRRWALLRQFDGKVRPVLEVGYDELTGDPSSTVGRIAGVLGLEGPQSEAVRFITEFRGGAITDGGGQEHAVSEEGAAQAADPAVQA